MKSHALLVLLAWLLCSCSQPLRQDAAKPAAIVATANPLATGAALSMLARGGSAVDAAVAAQMVLGLVEPQSSGIGGGALAMFWDARTRQLGSWDGLAAAPARTTAGLNIDIDGTRLDADAVRRGGRSVGVPGALALFATLHERHGKLPWAALFEPAITLADNGFAMPRYLHTVLSLPNAAAEHPQMRSLYFDAAGQVLPLGTMLRNPAYAGTLRAIAALGHQGWLRAGGARDFVAAAQGGAKPSLVTEADLLNYRAARAAVRTISACARLRDGAVVLRRCGGVADVADAGTHAGHDELRRRGIRAPVCRSRAAGASGSATLRG